jgi:hypothetical protein
MGLTLLLKWYNDAEKLIGLDAVDTMPLETIENFRDRGKVGGR